MLFIIFFTDKKFIYKTKREGLHNIRKQDVDAYNFILWASLCINDYWSCNL